jgi:hypothetical protein
MSHFYDHAGLAAVVITRIAAEESEGPGQLTGRMTEFVADLVGRNRPDAAAELDIALARQHFIILDAVAQAINLPVDAILDALELEQMENIEEGD